jgi:hypothetical protein
MVFKSTKWPNKWRGRKRPFIVHTWNLPIGVSEIRICPIRDPNMSRKRYWNLVLAPDMSVTHRFSTGKAAGPNMSDPGTGYVQRIPLKPGETTEQIRQKDLVARGKGLTGYNWSKSRTYPAIFSGTWQRGQISHADWKILEACTCPVNACDRTTSKMRGLSPKIISGDSR